MCARITDGIAGVVHTAALHAPHVGHRPESEFRAVNIEATDYLLRQAARHGVRRFVYTSSTSVYGDTMLVRDRAAWVTEQLVAQPRDIYDDTKLAAEALTRDRSEAVPSAAVLRIARCFPEPRAVQAAHRLYRGVALHDVARAHRLALERSEVNATLNIAGPRLFRRADTGKLWLDARAVLAERAPHLVTLFHHQGWSLPERIDRVYDSGRAISQLDYHPLHGPASLAETGLAGCC